MTSENIERSFKVGDVVRAKIFNCLIGIIIEDGAEFTVFILATKSQYVKVGKKTYWESHELSHFLVVES